MATITYTNVAVDKVLKGVDTILEAEFGAQASIYKSAVYKKQTGPKSVRLALLDSEPLTRTAGAVTRRYAVEVSIYLAIGQRGKIIQEDEVNELSHRVQRVLEENLGYNPSSGYSWHDGRVEEIDNVPELYEEEDGVMGLSIVRIIYEVSVTEVGSAL